MVQHPLVRYRKLHGLSIYDLAERVGVSPATISRIENGRQRPSFDLIRRFLAKTDNEVTAADFFEGGSLGQSTVHADLGRRSDR